MKSAPAPRTDSGTLVDEVVRLQRIIHRLKQNPPGAGSADRSAHALLMTISHAGPMRLSDLATAVHVDASTVSRQAAQLVAEQLLVRQPHPEDGRASVVALTESGRAVVASLMERRRSFFEQTVRDWSEDDLRTFIALLHRFVDDTERTYAATCNANHQETSA
jgi:DNA-binding MarR family transcriptional regulator